MSILNKIKMILIMFIMISFSTVASARFIGVDPKGFDEKNIHSFNRYTYANNNPEKFVDPDGRSPILAARGLWLIGEASFTVATRLGAPILGGLLADAIWNVTHQESNEPASSAGGDNKETKGQTKPEVGNCPDCGGETSNKPGKIADDHDLTRKEVKTKIHGLKSDMKIPGNPDVEVCSNCGEVFPQTRSGGLGDSIGNINQ